jgi:transitional endoplasmic reticulum ATPase
LLDHLEALAPRLAATGIGSRSAEDARAVAQLCSVLDTVITQPGVFVIGATSRPELVDETVLFAGRLGLRVTLPLPGAGARTTLLAGLLAERAATGLTAQEIAFAAERAEGCSAAELALVADLYTAPAAATAGHVPAIERLLRIVDGLGSRWVLARDRAVDAAEDHVERSAR